ncbi:EYxxD motif small membrane protein [Salipaludibacillus daqingensis]
MWEVATDSIFLFLFLVGSIVFGVYFWIKLNKKRKLSEDHGTRDEILKKK